MIGLACVLAASCAFEPLGLLEAPSPAAFDRGVGLAGMPLFAAVREGSVAIGKWFDGQRFQDTEYVFWFNQTNCSRLFGYFAMREQWPIGEIERRWKTLSQELEGRVAFLIHLSAYPKTETLEIIEGAKANTVNLELRSARLSWPGGGIAAAISQIGAWQTRSISTLRSFPWWESVPFGGLLTPAEFRHPFEKPLPLGDFFGTWYYAEINAIPEMWIKPLTITLVSRSKTRTAHLSARPKATSPVSGSRVLGRSFP